MIMKFYDCEHVLDILNLLNTKLIFSIYSAQNYFEQ